MYDANGDIDTNLVDVCGCFMNPNTTNYPFSAQGKIPVICDPVCSVAKVQQGITSGNGLWTQNVCNETVCIIDNVAIDYLNTTQGGGVTFSQVCGSGVEGKSICYINGVTIDAINSKIQGSLDLSQNCGACANSAETPIPCLGNAPPTPSGPGFFNTIMDFIENHKVLSIGVLIGLILLVVLLLVLLV